MLDKLQKVMAGPPYSMQHVLLITRTVSQRCTYNYSLCGQLLLVELTAMPIDITRLGLSSMFHCPQHYNRLFLLHASLEWRLGCGWSNVM